MPQKEERKGHEKISGCRECILPQMYNKIAIRTAVIGTNADGTDSFRCRIAKIPSQTP